MYTSGYIGSFVIFFPLDMHHLSTRAGTNWNVDPLLSNRLPRREMVAGDMQPEQRSSVVAICVIGVHMRRQLSVRRRARPPGTVTVIDCSERALDAPNSRTSQDKTAKGGL